MRLARLLLFVTLSASLAAAQTPTAALDHKPDPTPRLGILIPVGPPDYKVLFDAFHQTSEETDGPFHFWAGTIAGVPTVLSLAPSDGVLPRSLAAEEMLHHFNIRALIYPGTSGGHLAPSDMRIGDIVLGAKHVDFSNFFLGSDGHIEAGEFNGVQRGMKHYNFFYADPALLGYLACSARHVAAATDLPAWANPKFPRTHPEIFYYGIQGTSTIYMADKPFIEKTMQVFHEIDEDGDWYSAFVAELYHVPYIEVSTISNSVYEFPESERGHPTPPAGEKISSGLVAQRLSNRITVDLIQHYGQQILAHNWQTSETDPFPASAYDHPKDPGTLTAACEK